MSFCQTHGQGGKYSVCGQCRLDEAFAAGRDAGLEEAAEEIRTGRFSNQVTTPKQVADIRALKGKKP